MSTLAQDVEALDRLAKFPKGQSADPTSNMTPEDKAKWEAMNDEHGDKFKKANGDMMEYFAKHPEKLKEKQMRDKAKAADQTKLQPNAKRPGPFIEIAGKTGFWKVVKFQPHKSKSLTDQRTIGEIAWGDVQKVTKAGKTTGKTFEARFFDKGNKMSVRWKGRSRLSTTYKEHSVLPSNKALDKLAMLNMELTVGSLPEAALDRDMAALKGEARMAALDVAANSMIGKTIIEQMGGMRAMRMIGASQIVWLKDGVGVKWPNKTRSKGNYFEVKLNGMDTYDLEFFNVTARTGKKSVKKFRGIYFDQLTDLFEKQTGWYLRMAADQIGIVAKGDEKDSKFEEGEKADPTENMNEEDAKKWRLENLKNRDKFTKKKASGGFEEGARIPDGWDSGYIEGDEDNEPEGSEIPDGSGNMDKRAAAVKVGPQGMFRHRWPWVYAHGQAEDLLKHDVVSFDQPPRQGVIQALLVVEGQTQPALIYSWSSRGMPAGLVVLKNDRKAIAEAEREVAKGSKVAADKEALTGLYGFTKKVQADCESCVRKVQKAAKSIAKRAYSKNEKVAEFLSTHAGRSSSLPAQILIAALGEMGPRVAIDMKRSARLEELRAERTAAPRGKGEVLRSTNFPPELYSGTKLFLEFDEKVGQYVVRSRFQDFFRSKKGLEPNTPAARKALEKATAKFEALLKDKGKKADHIRFAAPRGKAQQAIAEHISGWKTGQAANLTEISRVTSLRGVHFAKIMSAAEALKKSGLIEFDGVKITKKAKVVDSDYGYDDASKKKTAGRKYGLYGYSDRVASIGLAACMDVRAEAGRIATDLHRRRSAKHEKITAFLDTHCKTAECKYSNLLYVSYPAANMRMAALQPPRTVKAWLQWEE